MASKTIEWTKDSEPTIWPEPQALRLKKSMVLVGDWEGTPDFLPRCSQNWSAINSIPRCRPCCALPWFCVGLDYFFTDERKRHVVSVVRKHERIRLPEHPGASEVAYQFEGLDFKANERNTSAYLADFESMPLEKLKPHQRPDRNSCTC